MSKGEYLNEPLTEAEVAVFLADRNYCPVCEAELSCQDDGGHEYDCGCFLVANSETEVVWMHRCPFDTDAYNHLTDAALQQAITAQTSDDEIESYIDAAEQEEGGFPSKEFRDVARETVQEFRDGLRAQDLARALTPDTVIIEEIRDPQAAALFNHAATVGTVTYTVHHSDITMGLPEAMLKYGQTRSR